MTKVTYPTGENKVIDLQTGELKPVWQRFFFNVWTRIGGGSEVTFAANGLNVQVGIGTDNPAESALLELSSTTGALLLPRMTTAQRDALTGVNGMMIYNSSLNKSQSYENGAWASLI